LAGYAHYGELYDAKMGLALDVPFDIIDFIEVLQAGELETTEWYDYLNLGYKLTPAAGSDYPYGDLPGNVRSYIHVEHPFSIPKCFDALKAGNTFVTTAHVGAFGERSTHGL